MNGRERVLRALRHQTTDRIPIAMVCSGINEPARSEFDAYLRRSKGVSAGEFLRDTVDIASVSAAYAGPSVSPGEDMWGVVRTPVSYGEAAYDEIIRYPLAAASSVSDLDAYRWPDVDWFDYSVIPGRIESVLAERERAIMVANGNIFESSWYMRGFERMFLDFVLEPAFAHALLGRVTDFYVEFFTRVLEAGGGEIDLVFTADDLGGQQGLLMSREMWEEFVQPHHRRLNELIHSFGATVIYHTDGAVMEVVDGLVEMGIDVLQALQFDAAGMDPSALKTMYGRRLCFEGGVSVQHTLPHLAPEAVTAEVKQLITVLGEGGGYILGPSHAIQAGTPSANIAAMFDTALSFYPHGQ
jgi:uroporphyrinogen decarboxylase